MQHIQHFHVVKQSSVFERRITTLEWHPTDPTMLAIGIKNGQIALWNHTKPPTEMKTLIGRHHFKAGKVTGLKFSPLDSNKLFSVAGDGTLQLHNLSSDHSETIVQSGSWDFWFTSLDYSAEHNLLVGGETRGYAHLIDLRTNKPAFVDKPLRMHKDKLVDVNFNHCDGNIFATASNDHTVGLWDLRMLGPLNEEHPGGRVISDMALSLLPHTGVINSVCFSPITRTKLLTTSQDEELRIYDIHKDLTEPLVIRHPHRFYQYLTPFKATWHPLHENIFVCGRYERGDSSQGRSVDVMRYEENPHFEGGSDKENSTNASDTNVILFGEENKKDLTTRRYRLQVCQLFDAQMKTLSPLNKFNANGEELASGAAGVALVWNYLYQLNAGKPQQPKKRGNGRRHTETVAKPPPRSRKRKATNEKEEPKGGKTKPPLKKTPSSGKVLEQFCYKGSDNKKRKGEKG